MNPVDSPDADGTLWLFMGVVCVLVLASALGAVLRARVARRQPHAAIDRFNHQVNGWWTMVVALALAFALGKTGVVLLFALVSFHALREFMTLAYTRRGDHHAIAAAFFIALPLQYILVWRESYGLYTVFIPVYVFLLLPILSAASADTNRFLERTAKVQWGLMVCVFCISHVPALLTLHIPGFEGRNLLLVAFLVLVVQGADVLRYLWGKLLDPAAEPAGSWRAHGRSLLAGVLSATLLGASLSWATPFTVWEAAWMALLCSVMGYFGGLVMSAIKRDRGVKDWGTLIEGHGGMLDRLDSVIFAAPVFFHALRYGWVG